MTFKDPDKFDLDETKLILFSDAERFREGLKKDCETLIDTAINYLIQNGTDISKDRVNKNMMNMVFSLVLHLKDSNTLITKDEEHTSVKNDIKTFVLPIIFEDAIKVKTIKELRDEGFEGVKK
jgi:hypothetical protein